MIFIKFSLFSYLINFINIACCGCLFSRIEHCVPVESWNRPELTSSSTRWNSLHSRRHYYNIGNSQPYSILILYAHSFESILRRDHILTTRQLI